MITRHFCIFDTETTGLDPEKGHEIIQLAASAVNYFDLSDHHAGNFCVYIKPQNPELADPESIELVKPVYEKAMAEGLAPKIAYEAFLKWVKSLDHQNKTMTKPMMVANNIRFDMKHLIHALKKYGLCTIEEDLPWMVNIWFDIQQSFFELFSTDPNVDNTKLDTMARVFGSQERITKHHDAVEDVQIEKEVFIRHLKFFRTCKSRIKIV